MNIFLIKKDIMKYMTFCGGKTGDFATCPKKISRYIYWL